MNCERQDITLIRERYRIWKMFILTTIADLIQIKPSDFTKTSAQALEDNINEKYANQIVQRVGLCICFYDLLSASEGLIGHGDGNVNVKVEFRLLVFRPFKGEIIEGIVSDATPLGLRLHVEFFDDILAPPNNLFHESHYDKEHKTFIWVNKDDDSGGIISELLYERNDRVRFRVEEEVWNDLAADADEAREIDLFALNSNDAPGIKSNKDKEDSSKRPAWSLVVSMCQAGCGMINWW